MWEDLSLFFHLICGYLFIFAKFQAFGFVAKFSTRGNFFYSSGS